MARKARKSRAGLERWKNFVECLRLMNFAFTNVRLYPPAHASVTETLTALQAGLASLLEEQEDVGYGFMDEMLYVEGAMSLEETQKNEMLVERFARCRVKYLTIEKGIERADLLKFFVALNDESKKSQADPPSEVIARAGVEHMHVVEAEVADTESKSKLARRKTLLDWYERACGVVKDVQAQLFKGPAADLRPLYRVADDLMATVRTKGFEPLPLVARLGAAPDPHIGHAVNVAMLCCSLGELHGLNSGQLQTLCAAAFLHDMGRCVIPPEWTKTGAPLSLFERSVVHQHASWGFLLLARCPEVPPQLAVLAGRHHDDPCAARTDGYASDVFHRILHAADVYDLATFSDARYWRKHRPDRILRHIMRRRAVTADAAVVKLLGRLVGWYPVGALVSLDDGRRGVVVRSNPTHPGRPKVCLLGEEGALPEGAPEGFEAPPVVVDCLDPDAGGLGFAHGVAAVLGTDTDPEARAWLERKKDYLVGYGI
ncbi:MAG: HD domain-containing protein [Elusimicrobia bacterium]|nr:HD domain-containing protein [Elusimicrobiota bacterium]